MTDFLTPSQSAGGIGVSNGENDMTLETLSDLNDVVSDATDTIIKNAEYVRDLRGVLGLDDRSAYGGLYVDVRNEEFIAVTKQADSVLQYYGGFEYIDKEFRKEYGDYVFYLAEPNGDGRVNNCFERMKMSKMTPEAREKYLEKKEAEEERRYNWRHR